METAQETIAALATPAGRGGIGVIRVSGPAVSAIATALTGQVPPPRQARYGPFKDRNGTVIDTGIALYFPAPYSFTGDPVLELQGHGGPVVMDMLLASIVGHGARLARPGEFSQRAFLNGKLDLVQAEAVADLVNAASEGAVRGAQRALQGEFSALVRGLAGGLTDLRAQVEAALDFPTEELDLLQDEAVGRHLSGLSRKLEAVMATTRQGVVLREGLRLVITGPPNVGKSSLLNRLCGQDRAIVSAQPGTTRDLLHQEVTLGGVRFELLDSAGLRAAADVVEREGIKRARQAIADADLLLWVTDWREPREGEHWQILAEAGCGPVLGDQAGDQADDRAAVAPGNQAKTKAMAIVHNKIDITGHPPRRAHSQGCVHLWLSALTGDGMALLQQYLLEMVGGQISEEGVLTARRRHLEALTRAGAAIDNAREHLSGDSGELLAEELRLAQLALGEITGEVSTEQLLDRIFAEFCIGK